MKEFSFQQPWTSLGTPFYEEDYLQSGPTSAETNNAILQSKDAWKTAASRWKCLFWTKQMVLLKSPPLTKSNQTTMRVLDQKPNIKTANFVMFAIHKFDKDAAVYT